MPKYRVNLVAVAEYSTVVEAKDEDDALDFAAENAPRLNVSNDFDMGDWTTASELWPESKALYDDIELLED